MQGLCWSSCTGVAVQGLGKTITGLALICKTRGTIPTTPLNPDGTPFKCTWVKDSTGRPAAFYTGAVISSVIFPLVLAHVSALSKSHTANVFFTICLVPYTVLHVIKAGWSESYSQGSGRWFSICWYGRWLCCYMYMPCACARDRLSGMPAFIQESIQDKKLVKTVVLVGLIGMHKTGCSGETRLVPHVPSSSWAGKRFN